MRVSESFGIGPEKISGDAPRSEADRTSVTVMMPVPGSPGPPSVHDAAARARQAAQALTYSLANPYPVSSHYAQAYIPQQQQHYQSSFGPPSWTSSGPSTSYLPQHTISLPSHILPSKPKPTQGVNSHRRGPPQQYQTHWYEPGNVRCTYEQCTFQGAKKSLEIHMMDRHLIFPPDWHKRKRRSEWDTDPSLNNGKPLPIQGTSIFLDTQETIDAWIAERKKRWPSAAHIKDKEQKLKEAVERGELFPSETLSKGRKRARADEKDAISKNARGRGRGRGEHSGRPLVHHPLPPKPVFSQPPPKTLVKDDGADFDSSSGSDMDPEKDAVSSKNPVEPLRQAVEEPVTRNPEVIPKIKDTPLATTRDDQEAAKPFIRRPPPQPKSAPHNPFGNRSSLLRNLLLPEIRMTVSNLSQVIHFLVQNDFLENVELNPGDADRKLIEVVVDSEVKTDTSQRSHEKA